MKTRLWGVLAGIVVLGLLAVTVTACGGAKKAAAGTAVVTTLAGQAGSLGSAEGSGVAARFENPYGTACDAAGNLYVADTGNSTIRKITPVGQVTTLAGSYGSADGTGTAARFNNPCGVACDTDATLYVTDVGNFTIRKITSAGKVTTLAGKAGSQGSADGSGAAARFYLSFGIACDAAGNVYVADTYNCTIRKITSTGKVTTLAGIAGSQGSTDGTGAAASFFRPAGIACDTAGNLYVADTWNNTIPKITPAGEVSTLAGKAGPPGSADGSGAAARFVHPGGIACDAAGNLYVADTLNFTIRKITPVGDVTTLAGQVGSQSNVDGSGTAASFFFPSGIACDTDGNLFVTDNDTIRKITLSH